MDIKIRQDRIISRAYNEEYALVEIEKVENISYCYKATLLANSFPQKLVDHMKEWTECVDTFAMSLIDEITEEIKVYDLWLAENNVRIFNIEMKDSFVTFFTKFPTAKGFLDDYPE